MTPKIISVMYLQPIPLQLSEIKSKMGGKIEGPCLVTPSLIISELGKVQCSTSSKRKAKEELVSAMKEIKSVRNDTCLLAIGEVDNEGKMSVFVPSVSNISRVLAVELELLVRDLGLYSEKTPELCTTISNEMITSIAIRYNLNTGSPVLHEARAFSGILEIDERLKRELIKKYGEKLQEYTATVSLWKSSSLLKRLTKVIGDNQKQILTSVATGLIAEAIVRIIVYFSFIGHREDGKMSINRLKGVPPLLLAKINSQKVFSAYEIASLLNSDTGTVVCLLNMLRDMKIVRLISKENGAYKGTGVVELRAVVGANEHLQKIGVSASTAFHEAASITFNDKDNDLNCFKLDDRKPNFNLNLVRRIYEEVLGSPNARKRHTFVYARERHTVVFCDFDIQPTNLRYHLLGINNVGEENIAIKFN